MIMVPCSRGLPLAARPTQHSFRKKCSSFYRHHRSQSCSSFHAVKDLGLTLANIEATFSKGPCLRSFSHAAQRLPICDPA